MKQLRNLLKSAFANKVYLCICLTNTKPSTFILLMPQDRTVSPLLPVLKFWSGLFLNEFEWYLARQLLLGHVRPLLVAHAGTHCVWVLNILLFKVGVFLFFVLLCFCTFSQLIMYCSNYKVVG